MRLQVGVHGPVPLHTLNCTAETHRCSQNSSADSRCAARSFIGAVSPLIIFHARRFKLFKIARFGGPKFGVRRQKDATLELLCGALQLIRPTRTGEIVYPPGRI
jgi:hypothetical protein